MSEWLARRARAIGIPVLVGVVATLAAGPAVTEAQRVFNGKDIKPRTISGMKLRDGAVGLRQLSPGVRRRLDQATRQTSAAAVGPATVTVPSPHAHAAQSPLPPATWTGWAQVDEVGRLVGGSGVLEVDEVESDRYTRVVRFERSVRGCALLVSADAVPGGDGGLLPAHAYVSRPSASIPQPDARAVQVFVMGRTGGVVEGGFTLLALCN